MNATRTNFQSEVKAPGGRPYWPRPDFLEETPPP
jgi:hypothetical protein